MTADLHCHTRLSDGTMGIEDLIILAQKSKIETIAITDHDCLAGTVRGKLIGERHGVKVIPGVELSAYDYERNAKVHMLCYLPESPNRLEGLCRRTSMARKRAGQMMLVKAAAKFPISTEYVLKCATGSTNIFKQHIMQALMDAGYTGELYGKLYEDLFSAQSEESIVSKVKYPDVFEVLEAIQEAGGIAVLAHPGLYDNYALIPELVEAGLDGLEVWHPRHDAGDIDRLENIAAHYDLLMTGGTDFHGAYSYRPITLGACGTSKEHLDKLLGYKAKKRRLQKKAAAQSAAE